MKKILVVGATGFLGMEICRQLTGNHNTVFGFVRKTASKERAAALKQIGVQLVEGDLKDSASVKQALNRIDVVISTASSTISRQDGDSIASVDRQGQMALIDAAATAGIKQFVYVSTSPMPEDSPLIAAKKQVEKRLMASGMTYTVLQPTFFMDVWLSPAIGFDFPNAKATIYGDGSKKISWIAIRDVAAFAVAALENPLAKNKQLVLGGPEALSPLEAVALFEKTSKRKFEVQHVPVQALEGQKAAAPDDLSKSFASLMLIYAAGDEINMQKTLVDFPMKLRSVGEYANEVAN